MRSSIAIVLLFVFPAVSFSATIHVPGDYPTIQQAADAASAGDTILVQPGTYAPVHMTTKAIAVMSSKGAYCTIIEGDPLKFPVVSCGNGFVLNGFTVRNGHYKGGIIANGSIIRNCVITDNHSENSGGGMKIDGTTALVNNIIYGNEASDLGSTGERGGGVEIVGTGSPIILNTTICYNDSDWGGGICCTNNATPIITNCILWGNTATQNGDQIFGSGCTVTYSDVEGGWSGLGNIDANPLFVDSAAGDFHLTYTSPCRGSGNNAAAGLPNIDFERDPRVFQGIVDMGADEFANHMYCTGSFSPNGSIVGKFVGVPGTWPVGLFIGSGVLDPPSQHGWGYFYLQSPWLLFELIPIPSNGVLSIPATIPSTPAPYDIPMQALIGWKLSNLFVVDVR